ncbi:MAG TPA: cytochrome P450 [Actinophytocola sp.]|uniref:cytochrome P450 n=1 Tax=Actinophytocola sp. TaxID=1872138 RepID=UPI002DB5D8AC|nr:cytochrome P450 [Actinophytocola sp.]HEU5474641.1 cytochrome P450 [Actinophytocola sp.]
MLSLDTLDITDEAAYAANGYPYPEWELLRREAPMFWYVRPGFEPFWVVTRHADIASISRHTKLFSSAQRVTIFTPEAVEMLEVELEQRAQMFGHDPADPSVLPVMDSPRHRHLRKVLAPCFTPKAVSELEDRFAELAATYVKEFTDRIDEHGSADVAKYLAARLPVAAICELLNAPVEDWDDLFNWTQGMTAAADPEFWLEGEDAEAAFRRNIGALNQYVATLIQRRMAEGDPNGTDVLSRLATGVVEGRPLEFHEILYTVHNLLVAGISTTRNATAGGIQALLEHPEQLRMLVEDPGLVDRAAEEILRWTTIAVSAVRTCTEDTEIGGQRIRKGETLAMWFPAGNRDGEVFDDPYRFDITRTVNPHVAFGGQGEHVCIGSHLARLELRALLRAVLPVLPELEIERSPDLGVLHLQVAELKRLFVRRKKK